jgi:iron complex outermembrane recepter protein
VKLRFVILAAFLYSLSFKTQTISGVITDSLKAPVPYVPLGLLNAKDSSIVKGTNTNDNGHFIFKDIKPGKYLLKIEAVGFETKITSIYTIDSLRDLNTGPLAIHPSAVNLNEVSVTTVKKLVEFKNGNITVNIENSPLAVGNSLYDLLSRLPTVTIIDDVISIQGKEGVRILIDGRLQQMSGQPLINLLKSIQASTIEKIEILKNPPVKYDAAGTGFISVKTKKLKITGFSGSANLSYNQGFYSNQDAGLSLNYKGKSFAVFSSINGGNDEMRYVSRYDKRITYNDITTNFYQRTTEKDSNLYASYNFGADWYLNKHNTVGFRIEGSNGRFVPKRNGTNTLSDDSPGYDQLVFSSVRPNSWDYINYNINSEHLFDTIGTTLRLSFDYSPNIDLHKGDFQNYFLDSSGNHTLPPRIFKSDNNLKFVIYSGKLDFEKQLSKTLKLETGVKGNEQSMVTGFNFNNKNTITGEYTVDTVFTNSFTYKEQIYAGYVNFSKEIKKFSFQLGVRGENTNIRAGSVNKNITFTRDYFNLFPLANLNYNPSEKHSWQLSYNRRINRPNYTSFNPYKFFLNLLVSYQGNPYLLPEYRDNFEFTHGYKNSIYTQISVSIVHHAFLGYPLQNDSTKESLFLQSNLGNAYIYSYNPYIQKDLTKWWNISLSGWASYITLKGKIGDRDYSGISFQSGVFITNQLTLPKSFKAEISGRYLAPVHIVIDDIKSQWALDFAVRKNILKDKLNVSVGMNDVFYTWIRRTSTSYLNINSQFKGTFDTRRFKASLTYNFGKVKVQQRQTKSNEEEKARLSH